MPALRLRRGWLRVESAPFGKNDHCRVAGVPGHVVSVDPQARAGKNLLADACGMIDNGPDRSGSFSPGQFLLGCPTPEAPPAILS